MIYKQSQEFDADFTSYLSCLGEKFTPHQVFNTFGKGRIYDSIDEGDGKVRWEWLFQDEDGNTFTIYDYKSNTAPHQKYDWHVGGGGVTKEQITDFIQWFVKRVNNVDVSPMDAEEYDPEMVVVVGSMWDGESPFKPRHDELWAKLVPTSGMCETTYGEALRCIARLYYDAYNNGGCNSTLHHFQYYVFYLMEWSDSQEGWSPSGALKSLDGRLRYARRQEARQVEHDRKYCEEDSPSSWDALEDQEYLTALEEVAHWVTWKVSKLNQ